MSTISATLPLESVAMMKRLFSRVSPATTSGQGSSRCQARLSSSSSAAGAAAELDELNLAWHRLDPWPDVVEGLTRLKRRFTIATLSNGNVALMVDMAKRAGLPWDAILGAEPARAYKPAPKAYLR